MENKNNQNNNRYWTIKELMEIPIVEKRFFSFREVGIFIKNFDDKIDHYRTARKHLVNKELFVKFLKHVETYN